MYERFEFLFVSFSVYVYNKINDHDMYVQLSDDVERERKMSINLKS